jgi:hypothetical protein
MEYRTEEENGEAAWYKVTGNRNTPVKVTSLWEKLKADTGIYNLFVNKLYEPRLKSTICACT